MDAIHVHEETKTNPKLAAFDETSGSALERLVFHNRIVVLAICLLATLVLGYSLKNLQLNASFESFIPLHQPYIVNYEKNKNDLGGLSGNTINIVVEANKGTILNKNYLLALEKINDQVFLLPGVDRAFMRSLWTSAVRWTSVTSTGIDGGPVMPRDFDGSAASLAELEGNIQRSGEIGSLVAADNKSSVISVPLLAVDRSTMLPLNYGYLAKKLDQIRVNADGQDVTVHITGFAMIVGDLIKGMRQIIGFFAISVSIATAMVFWFTRCIRSTLVVVFCSLLAVVWQLGLLPIIGYSLDPYSVLFPFLVFAIGVSHGAQKMNGVMQDIGRGNTSLVAARMTFRRLFIAGFTALICDAVGFAVLMTIRIEAIQHLAIVASLGVAILIFTNLIVLPVLLSYIGVNQAAATRSLQSETDAEQGRAKHRLWAMVAMFTQRRYATIVLICAALLGVGGLAISRHLQIGDVDPGAPELRANSTYNQDNAYFVNHYSNSSDSFVVMVKTPGQLCGDYDVLANMDQLESQLRELPGVVSVSSFADFERMMSVEMNEGNFKWDDLVPDQAALNETIDSAPVSMHNDDCNFLALSVYLKDHRAATLTSVTNTVLAFTRSHNLHGTQFMLAAGNGGVEEATNLVVDSASRRMLIEVYAAVIVLCMITFRSWRAVFAAILPLMLTSILAEALMVELGIGVKVATLPVTALGVGIGVDYALYILSVTLANLRLGMPLSEAYYRTLLFTGKVVMLTGFTLAAAVMTWIFSPIKFQADMGELLAFMFLLNMVGALVLLPALCSFLLPSKIFTANKPDPEMVMR